MPMTVAFVGQNGMFGGIVLKELRKHDWPSSNSGQRVSKIRCLSRKARGDCGKTLQENLVPVENVQVDYKNIDSLVKALQGCYALVSCMGTEGNYMQTKKYLVEAAAKAGVQLYITSDFGIDHQIQGTELFGHPCWSDKAAHRQYAASLGLKAVAIYIGLFMEKPWSFADIWHGLDKEALEWAVVGDGNAPLTLTSKYDAAKSVRRVIELCLDGDLGSIPDTLRIKGSDYTPNQLIAMLNNVLAAEGVERRWVIKPLTEEQQVQEQLKRQLVAPVDEAELAVLGPDFDPVFASEIAERIFRGMGEGFILGAGPIHNELVNPKQSLWQWRSPEEYFVREKGDI